MEYEIERVHAIRYYTIFVRDEDVGLAAASKALAEEVLAVLKRASKTDNGIVDLDDGTSIEIFNHTAFVGETYIDSRLTASDFGIACNLTEALAEFGNFIEKAAE